MSPGCGCRLRGRNFRIILVRKVVETVVHITDIIDLVVYAIFEVELDGTPRGRRKTTVKNNTANLFCKAYLNADKYLTAS